MPDASSSAFSAFPPIPPIPGAPDHTPLILPPTEDRPHAFFTLPNGLEAIVVSDATTEKAAAAMCVGVGHLSDPIDLPGCAHFCEHLLFMGTKKFPKENDYQVFLTENNGHSNAWTAMTETVYFFDVDSRKLEGALDRFSGFFQEPLFNEDCTEREIKAVDSEHKKNLQNDMWRNFQLEKHVSKAGHAYTKFGTGDYKTLWSDPKKAGRDPRQQLIDWWAKEYCARRMKLVVIGRESTEELEKMVRDRFVGVPVRTKGAPEVGEEGRKVAFLDSPLGAEQRGRVTFVQPVRDQRGLEISFPFPDLHHLYQSQPIRYITHFIGHEGRGSLLSYLKKQGWVNILRAGPMDGAAGFELVKITVDLTPSGLENWQKVALAIFKYLKLLRSGPPSSTAFNEQKQIADISFKFAEKSKAWHYVTMLAGWMQHAVPREKIVSSVWVMEQYKEDELRAALELMDPHTAAVGVTCKELPKDVEGTWDQTEPIYGTTYKQMRLPEEFMKEATSGEPIPDFSLPGPNDYIAERLDVDKFAVHQPAVRPTLVRDVPLSRLWYKRDDRFWLPKAYVSMTLRSPLFNATPRHHVLGRLLADVFTDATAEDTYDASLAELSFGLNYQGTGLGLQAAGFSDKLPRLLEDMLRRLVKLEVDPQRFAALKDDIKQSWTNFPLNEPYRTVAYWKSFATTENVWTHPERLAELEHVTPEDVAAFAKEVFQRLHVETLVHGNTSQAEAEKLQEMVDSVLGARALTDSEKVPLRSLLLPTGSEHVWTLPVANTSEVNNAVIYWCQLPSPSNRRLRVALQLYAQVASEPTFDQLRTKEQLGYITQSSSRIGSGQMDFQLLVQSERDPVYVETRIESFLDSMRDLITKMSEEEFDKFREAVIARKEEKPKNLGEETSRFWGCIGNSYYEFGGRETDIANLRKVTKQDLLDLHDTYISTASATRSKFSVHMKSQYKGSRTTFDAESAAPLMQGMTKHGVPVDPEEMAAFMASNPTLDAVKAMAAQAIDALASLGQEAKDELAKAVEGLKEKTVDSAQDGEAKLRESNVPVHDIQAFKASLTSSEAPMPLEPLKPEQAKL